MLLIFRPSCISTYVQKTSTTICLTRCSREKCSRCEKDVWKLSPISGYVWKFLDLQPSEWPWHPRWTLAPPIPVTQKCFMTFFQCFSFTWNIMRPSCDSSDASILSASITLDLSLRMPSFKRVGPWSSFNCQSARCINLDTSQQRLPKIGQRVDTALSQSASLRLHTDSESERNS